jgi:opacity protein-like surface antigen
MLRKKIVSAIIGAGFLAALVSTPAMADASLGGTVKYKIEMGSSTKIKLDEAELKYKSKGETSNGWKVSSELELEIKGDSSFDVEEASVKLDMGMFAIIGGILEEEGAVAGVIDEASDVKAGKGDEEPGLRVALNLMEGLDFDFTIAMHGAGSGGTETRIQLAYDLGFGKLSLITDSAPEATVKSAMHIGLAMSMGQISPFVGMTTLGSSSETILGLDYALSDDMTVGVEMVSASGSSTTGVGVEYKIKPITICASAISSGGSSSMEASVEYKF